MNRTLHIRSWTIRALGCEKFLASRADTFLKYHPNPAPGGRIEEKDPLGLFSEHRRAPDSWQRNEVVCLSRSLYLSNERLRTKDAAAAAQFVFICLILCSHFPLAASPAAAAAGGPAHASPRPTTVCLGGPAQIGPNGQYEGSARRRGRGRLPHCPFLPSSSLSLSPSFGLRRTSSVKVECAALLDSVSVHFRVMGGLLSGVAM